MLESAVIVEVVAGEVGEKCAFEVQTADAVLMNGVRRAFHEGIIAAGFDHFGQKRVERDRIGGGVGGFHGAIVDIVAHRRDQSHFIAQTAVELIEHGGNRRLAVGAGHADEAKFARGVAVKTGGDRADQTFGVGHANEGEGVRSFDGLAHQNGGGSVLNGLVHKRVAVGLGAFDGHKEETRADTAGVNGNAGDVGLEVTDELDNFCR